MDSTGGSGTVTDVRSYDAARDGKRFLTLARAGGERARAHHGGAELDRGMGLALISDRSQQDARRSPRGVDGGRLTVLQRRWATRIAT
jgi:hypothetical protein